MAWQLRSRAYLTPTVPSGDVVVPAPTTLPSASKDVIWAELIGKYYTTATNVVYESADLVGWATTALPAASTHAYFPEAGLLFGGRLTDVWSTADGVTSTTRLTPASNATRLVYLSAVQRLFCLTASSTIYYTDDGLTWASATCDITPSDIAFANGLYVVCGPTGALQTSPDLTTWTSRTAPNTSYTINNLATSPAGVVIATAFNRVFRSEDCITWTQPATFASATVVGYSPAEDLFIVAGRTDGSYALLATSADGVTWVTRPNHLGAFGVMNAARYMPTLGAFVFGGVQGGLATTTDGTTIKSPALVNGLLVASVAFRGNAPFALPAEWTLIAQNNTGNTSTTASSSIASGLLAYHYTADGTLPTDSLFTRTGGDVAIATSVAYAGDGPVTVDASVAVTAASNSATVAAPAGLTTSEPGCLLVGLGALADTAIGSNMIAAVENTATSTDAFAAPSATWYRRVTISTPTGADAGAAMWDCVKPSAGSTGQIQYTAGVSSRHVIMVAAFKAAAPPSGVTADAPLSSASINPPAAAATPAGSSAGSLPSTALTAPAAAATTATAVLASGAFDNIALSSPAGSAAPAGAWVGSLQDVWLLPPSGAHAASAAAAAAVAGVSLSAVQATLDTRTSGAAGCSSVTLVAPSGAGGVLNIGEAAGALAPMMLSPTAGGGQGMGGGQGTLTTTSLLAPRASATARTEAAGTISSVMVQPPTGAGGTQAEAFGSGELRQIGVTRPGALSIPAGYAQGAFQTADLTPPNAAQVVLVRGAGGAAAVAITPPETNATAVSETRAAAPLPGLSATPAQGTVVADVAAGAAVVPLSVTPVTASAVAQAIAVGEGGLAPSSITAPAASAAQELTAYAAIEPLLLVAAASDGEFVAVADAPLPAWTLLAPNGAPGVDAAGQGAMGGVTIAAPRARGGDSLLVGHASAAVRVRKHESVAMVRIQVGGDGYAGSDERVRTAQRVAVTRNMPSWRYR